MHNESEIAACEETLIEYLEGIQNKDGSFEAAFYFPSQPQNGWTRWGNPPFDTAAIIIPLLDLRDGKAERIIKRGVEFIIEQSLDRKAWKYASGQGYDPMLYDLDATALCSYALANAGYEVSNKHFLNHFIDKDGNYKAWMFSLIPSAHVSVVTYIKILWNNTKALLLNKLNISLADREFAMNSNVLLYTGRMKKNKHVWDKHKSDFENDRIECRYYDQYYCIYAYARVCRHFAESDIRTSDQIIKQRIDKLYKNLNSEEFNLHPVFLANAILLFGLNIKHFPKLADLCFSHIQKDLYKEPAAYYTSNLIHDKHPDKDEALNVFGSSGLTCSLYIEFINLYNTSLN